MSALIITASLRLAPFRLQALFEKHFQCDALYHSSLCTIPQTRISTIHLGRKIGFPPGPAKVAVISSALYGTVSGSTVANVYATGSFTIPMMKQTGYKPREAAAVEAISGVGGQIMPPIMGAGSFKSKTGPDGSCWYPCGTGFHPASSSGRTRGPPLRILL